VETEIPARRKSRAIIRISALDRSISRPASSASGFMSDLLADPPASSETSRRATRCTQAAMSTISVWAAQPWRALNTLFRPRSCRPRVSGESSFCHADMVEC
jgi:hypothetical protein